MGSSESENFGWQVAYLTPNSLADGAPTKARLLEVLASSDPAVAINLFGDGSAQNPNLGELASPWIGPHRGATEMKAYDLAARGQLFELPGGRVSYAVGTHLHEERIRLSQQDYSDTPGRPLTKGLEVLFGVEKPKRDLTAFFAEFAFPIFGDGNARPGVRRCRAGSPDTLVGQWLQRALAGCRPQKKDARSKQEVRMSNESITTEDETQILDAIDRWLERDVRDKVMDLEQADEYPHEMVEQMRELGLFGATIPAEYGGLGLPAGIYAKIVTRISEVWMSLTGIFNSHLIMSKAVERFGTQAQRDRFLPRFASGEIRGGLALTEPTIAAPISRPSEPPPSAKAATLRSTAPRPGSPTASRAAVSHCSSRPIRRSDRDIAA